MTAVPEQYQPYLEDTAVAPSTLVAYLPSFLPKPDLHEIRQRLREAGRVVPSSVSEVLDAAEHDHGALTFRTGTGESALEFELVLIESRDFGCDPVPGSMSDEEAQALRNSEWALSLSTHLIGDNVLSDFHQQLRLLHTVLPDAVAVYDCAAYRTHSGGWLREIARSRVPPPPDVLYTHHVVHGKNKDTAWHHSHGLHRCGCVEIEMLDVPVDATEAFSHLLQVTAALFMEQGTLPPFEPFEAGRALPLVWLPWERAIELANAPSDSDGLGRGDDRDEYHDLPSGVLFAAGPDGQARPITTLQDNLEGEPLLYITAMETRRMALMAKEQFPRFRRMQRRFGRNEAWAFHVKLGYQVDDCPDDADDNEHLWFDVHEIRGGEMVATLLNQPYNIARMQEGDVDRHAMDQLSDWTIDSPHGLFSAASIGRLEELVGEA